MTLILIGMNHRTAPVDLHEKLALSESALQRAYVTLKSQMQAELPACLNDAVILSTCSLHCILPPQTGHLS